MQNLSRTWASQLPPQCTTRSWRVWTLYNMFLSPCRLLLRSPFPFYPFQQHTRTTVGGYFVMAVFLPVSSLLSGTIDLVLFLVSTRAFFYTSHLKKIKASQLNLLLQLTPSTFFFLPSFRSLASTVQFLRTKTRSHTRRKLEICTTIYGRTKRTWKDCGDVALLKSECWFCAPFSSSSST